MRPPAPPMGPPRRQPPDLGALLQGAGGFGRGHEGQTHFIGRGPDGRQREWWGTPPVQGAQGGLFDGRRQPPDLDPEFALPPDEAVSLGGLYGMKPPLMPEDPGMGLSPMGFGAPPPPFAGGLDPAIKQRLLMMLFSRLGMGG